MSQLALFDSTHAIIVDDGKGRVIYTPRFVDVRTAASWLAELRSGVEWRAERRMMYEREVDVPRLVGHFRLDPAPASTPGAILEAAQRVIDQLDVPFNAVGTRRMTIRPKAQPRVQGEAGRREGKCVGLCGGGHSRKATLALSCDLQFPELIDGDPLDRVRLTQYL